jgi:3'(2'), 5'-bisphosphate nucleotidase
LTTADDHALAARLANAAGRLLLELRASGGDPDTLRKAGDRSSHEYLMAELAKARPTDAVLSEEGIDDKARLAADRVWIVDPLDGTREFGEPGREDWAVHVALWERQAAAGRGDLTAGAVALPAQDRALTTAAPPSAHPAPAGPGLRGDSRRPSEGVPAGIFPSDLATLRSVLAAFRSVLATLRPALATPRSRQPQ